MEKNYRYKRISKTRMRNKSDCIVKHHNWDTMLLDWLLCAHWPQLMSYKMYQIYCIFQCELVMKAKYQALNHIMALVTIDWLSICKISHVCYYNYNTSFFMTIIFSGLLSCNCKVSSIYCCYTLHYGRDQTLCKVIVTKCYMYL